MIQCYIKCEDKEKPISIRPENGSYTDLTIDEAELLIVHLSNIIKKAKDKANGI